jgi:hypothetical protein
MLSAQARSAGFSYVIVSMCIHAAQFRRQLADAHRLGRVIGFQGDQGFADTSRQQGSSVTLFRVFRVHIPEGSTGPPFTFIQWRRARTSPL